jgi:hypothetical protein
VPGHRAQRRRVVLGVLRSEGIEAVQLTDDPFFGSEFFELKRGQFDVQVIRLPDIVHYPTIERFKWRYGIAPERFYPPRPRRRRPRSRRTEPPRED